MDFIETILALHRTAAPECLSCCYSRFRSWASVICSCGAGAGTDRLSGALFGTG